MKDIDAKYPIGVQQFEKLRKEHYLYVDKTMYVHKLVAKGSCYFLSRPRRFGKSLLLSTLEAYFEGRKDLFAGLAIEQLEHKWEAYPVLHLDLNLGRYHIEGELDKVLADAMDVWDNKFGIISVGATQALRFKNLIANVKKKTGKPVVILIDEYDKPLLETLGCSTRHEDVKSILKSFYGNLKTTDGDIKFSFLTGVTKFGKVSVFSDLNNLNDISLDTDVAGICGITESELHQYFRDSIEQLAIKTGVSYSEMSGTLKKQYDGYRFSEEETEGVYNPFSLLNTFYKQRISDYWFETGTPTFLVALLKNCEYDLRNLQDEEQTSDMMRGVDTMWANPIPVIYQSGYLTIKHYDPEFKFYTLGFPNEEVARGFTQFLLAAYAPQQSKSPFFVSKFVQDVRSGKPKEFMRRMETFFAGSNYQIVGNAEKYFQNCLYLVFKMMGFYVHAEYPTASGRSGILIETNNFIYILETKLDGSAEEALRQITDKGYDKPFAQDHRKLFKIGVNFSSATRGIDKWLVQE